MDQCCLSILNMYSTHGVWPELNDSVDIFTINVVQKTCKNWKSLCASVGRDLEDIIDDD